MPIRLQKARDKYGDKLKPKGEQAVRACPYCGQDILITPNAPEAKKTDGFGLALAVVAVILLVMLYLMITGGMA